MNDKIQLAAMGEHMAEQAVQPLCMAKRIEGLEDQVRVMAGLLRDLHKHIGTSIPQTVSEHYRGCDLLDRIDAALAGKLPDHTEQPLAMVPGGAGSRDLFERWFMRDCHPDRQGPYIKDITWVAWQAALAAYPSPDGTK